VGGGRCPGCIASAPSPRPREQAFFVMFCFPRAPLVFPSGGPCGSHRVALYRDLDHAGQKPHGSMKTWHCPANNQPWREGRVTVAIVSTEHGHMSCGKATWCCYRTRLAAASPPASEPLALVASAIFALAHPCMSSASRAPALGYPFNGSSPRCSLLTVCYCMETDGVPAAMPILLAPAMSRHSTDRPSRSFPPSRQCYARSHPRIHASTPVAGPGVWGCWQFPHGFQFAAQWCCRPPGRCVAAFAGSLMLVAIATSTSPGLGRESSTPPCPAQLPLRLLLYASRPPTRPSLDNHRPHMRRPSL
jgi:hypothetical protein